MHHRVSAKSCGFSQLPERREAPGTWARDQHSRVGSDRLSLLALGSNSNRNIVFLARSRTLASRGLIQGRRCEEACFGVLHPRGRTPVDVSLAERSRRVLTRCLLLRLSRVVIKADRDGLKQWLESFARESLQAGPSGVPYLFVHFPEGDLLNVETLANSLEFARREVRSRCRRWCLQ